MRIYDELGLNRGEPLKNALELLDFRGNPPVEELKPRAAFDRLPLLDTPRFGCGHSDRALRKSNT
jgi:hypothetical protein